MADSLKKVEPSFKLEPNAQGVQKEMQLEELEKIRSILFGQQMAALQSQLESIQHELKSHVNSRIADVDSVIAKIRKDVDRDRRELEELLGSNKSENAGELELIQNNIKSVEATLADEIEIVRQDLSTSHSSIGERMVELEKTLAQKIREVSMELASDKAGRDQVAELLENMASQLRKQ